MGPLTQVDHPVKRIRSSASVKGKGILYKVTKKSISATATRFVDSWDGGKGVPYLLYVYVCVVPIRCGRGVTVEWR